LIKQERKTDRERERKGERERKVERERGRQRKRKRQRERDTHTERQREKEIESQRQRHRERDRKRDRRTDRRTDGRTDGRTNERKGRDGQTDSITNRQTVYENNGNQNSIELIGFFFKTLFCTNMPPQANFKTLANKNAIKSEIGETLRAIFPESLDLPRIFNPCASQRSFLINFFFPVLDLSSFYLKTGRHLTSTSSPLQCQQATLHISALVMFFWVRLG
jgi:hypothetical protein